MSEKQKNVPKLRFPGYEEVWEQKSVKDTFSFLQNNTLSRAELTYEGCAKNIHYGDVLVKFGEYLEVSKADLPYIKTQGILEKFSTSFLQDGDIIMADTAEDETVGKCTEIAELHGDLAISGLHTIPMRPKAKFASGYLGYYMNSKAYHEQLFPLMQGIKVTSVSKSAIQGTLISYPKNLAEQDAIGKCFIQLDTLIILQQRKLDQIKEYKKGMLQQMFPKEGETVPEVRFSGFTGEWEQRKLGEVFNQTSFIVNPKEQSVELWSLTVEDGLTPKTERYNREFLVKKEDNFKEVRPGDIVYNPMNMTLGAVGFNGMSKSVAVSGYYTTMVAKDGYDAYFINTWLKSDQAIKLYKSYATGTLIEKQRVQFPTFSIIPTVFPEYDEQKIIGQCFEQIDTLITLQQRKLEAMKEYKKGLLQQMFV